MRKMGVKIKSISEREVIIETEDYLIRVVQYDTALVVFQKRNFDYASWDEVYNTNDD